MTAPARVAETADRILRFVLALAFTPLVVGMAIAMQQFQLLAVLLVTLAVIGAVGGGHSVIERYPTLGRVKVLGGVLRTTGDLEAFYREHPPRTFLLYIVYPAYAVVGAITSKVVRREVLLHLRLLLIVFILVLFDAAMSYGRIYPPYLGWKVALQLLAVQLSVITFAGVVYLVPMVTTVYAFGVEGRRRWLAGLILGSVLLSLPIGYVSYTKSRDSVAWLDRGRLSARLKEPRFREHLTQATDMYLSWAVQRGDFDDLGDEPRVLDSEAFRRVVRGLVPSTEDQAFSLVGVRTREGEWIAVRMLQSARPFLLLVRAPDGHIVRRYSELPDSFKDKFTLGNARSADRRADRIARATLLDDL
ncbi:MAG: hypothetical protein U0271_23810 [Polyangiaceae bacterium]